MFRRKRECVAIICIWFEFKGNFFKFLWRFLRKPLSTLSKNKLKKSGINFDNFPTNCSALYSFHTRSVYFEPLKTRKERRGTNLRLIHDRSNFKWKILDKHNFSLPVTFARKCECPSVVYITNNREQMSDSIAMMIFGLLSLIFHVKFTAKIEFIFIFPMQQILFSLLRQSKLKWNWINSAFFHRTQLYPFVSWCFSHSFISRSISPSSITTSHQQLFFQFQLKQFVNMWSKLGLRTKNSW